MTTAVPDILARIVEHKRVELAGVKWDRGRLEALAEDSIPQRRDFAAAVESTRPAIIAEIKKASPSKGLLAPNFDPERTAVHYEEGGAAALSILTDQRFFGGSLEDLQSARNATHLPVLRKDFTVHELHVLEAAASGADAILLIAAILSDRELRDLRELATRYRMAALVEVHDREELKRAAGSGARIIGVNNRNLHTFQVTLQTSLELAPHMPDAAVRVSESGIASRLDVEQLAAAGYHAFLIGEHLMRSGDPRRALRELLT